MRAINIFEVVDANKALVAAGVDARLHLHDACGGQVLTISAAPGQLAEAQEATRAFFSSRGMEVAFDDVTGNSLRLV